MGAAEHYSVDHTRRTLRELSAVKHNYLTSTNDARLDAHAIGKRLSEMRVGLGWPQKIIAKRLKFDTQTISNIERGRSTTRVCNIIRWAEILNVDPLWVFFGEGDAPVIPSNSQENIAVRLKQARLFREMSQEQLAKKLGTTQGTYSRWESGLKRLGQDHCAIIAEDLEISAHWLYSGEGTMTGEAPPVQPEPEPPVLPEPPALPPIKYEDYLTLPDDF